MLPALAAAATGVLVGAAIVASRVVVDETGPASLALLRYAIGCCCLLPALLLSPRPRFARRDLVPIALLGIVQFGVLIVLLNHGLHVVPAARAALIFATMPALTMLVAVAFGVERLGLGRSLGVALTLGGVARRAPGWGSWRSSAAPSVARSAASCSVHVPFGLTFTSEDNIAALAAD